MPLHKKNMTENKKIADKDLPSRIDDANAYALEMLFSVEPVFIGVDTALNVIPGMTKSTILHSGPPIGWSRMCDPMKRAVRGAIIFEGLAKDELGAEKILRNNKITLSPNHHHDCVGPMTGIISPSMPVIITKDLTSGKKVYSTFNEGGGQVLWFGSFGKETLKRLKWIKDYFAPVMKKAVSKSGGVSIWNILSQGIQMGDECHNRHGACTNIFIKSFVEHLFSLSISRKKAMEAYKFISGNSHFFLNFTMTGCKLAMNAAHNIKDSTLVTAMSRNGTDFGIRVSGLGDKWFVVKSPYLPDALYNPGYGPEDGAPDIGDSSIIETMGLGGFAIAAAPSLASFAGGGFKDAVNITNEMGLITNTNNSKFAIPSLDFKGTPTGIDIRKVVDTTILPSINSAVVHRRTGVGQIGAGIVKAPYECFTKALIKFGKNNRLAA
ncbi:MAG: DUF1116 domain-containing protein [Thermodesulfobacteriota bacterium]